MNRDHDRPDAAGGMPDRIPSRGAPPSALLPAGIFTGGMVPAGASLPPGLSYTPSLVLLLKALQRRWLLASTIGLVAAISAAAGVWYSMYYHTEEYVARTSFWMEPTKPVFMMPPDRTRDIDSYAASQAQLIKDPIVSIAALRNPQIAGLSLVQEQPDAASWLASAIQVSSPWPEIMSIALPGPDRPEELELLLGAVKDAYLDESDLRDKQARQSKIERLRGINRRNEETLRRERERYQNYMAALAAVKAPVLAYTEPFAKEMIDDYTKDLIQTKKDLFKKRLDLQKWEAIEKGMVRHEPSKDDIEAALDEEPVVKDLKTQLIDVEAELAQARTYWVETHPLVLDLGDQIKSLKTALADYRTERWSALADELENQPLANTIAKVANLREEVTTLEQQEQNFESEIRRIQSTIQQVHEGVAPPSAIIDVDELKKHVDNLEQSVSKMVDQIDALEMEDNNVGPRVHWQGDLYSGLEIQEPEKLTKYAGMAGASALAVVLLLIAYWEFVAKRIHTGDDVVYGLGWRLVGALPALPNGRGGFLRKRDDKYWQSLLTESVDATRTTLLHAARTEGLRTVMVTSAVSGEGKTSLSCHLAFSLARAGRNTLLIDCDLRSPAAHRLFDLPVTPGFSELLRREVGLDEVIQRTPASNLSLIAAGRCDSHTLQSLAHEGLPPILDRLKEQFDFIVIDSSPVLPVVDALVMGQHVDVVIFSLLRGVSRIPNVYAAYQRLATLGIRMLGAVVNGVHRHAYGDSYNYYVKQPAR
jgi:capsular exopolysaccharide synthesis family protein